MILATYDTVRIAFVLLVLDSSVSAADRIPAREVLLQLLSCNIDASNANAVSGGNIICRVLGAPPYLSLRRV